MSEYQRHVGRFAGDAFRQVAGRFTERVFSRGFNEAESICLGAITAEIDALARSKSLSEHEKFHLQRLTKLRSEVESQIRQFWDHAPTDQRR